MKWTYLIVIISLFFPQLAIAQEEIVVVIDEPGRNKVPIALPKPADKSKAAEEFYAVVKNDLQLSGWVEVVDPASYIEPRNTGVRPNEFNFADWEITGANALAKTKFELGSQLRVEAWIYHVPSKQKLGAKAFTAKAKNVRNLAHRVADEIIYRITGNHAPFNTRFSVIGKFPGNKELYIVDFDGENRTKITRNGSINLKPTWNRSGNKIAFTSYLNGNPDLYLADLSRGHISRLSARSGINIGASWHPNDKQMAVTLSPKGNPDIYLINAGTGRTLKRLTSWSGIEASPSFSPDGTKIAFVSERSGGPQIYTMNSDGKNKKRVSYQGGHNTDPVFSPDGTKIAYVTRQGTFDIRVLDLQTGTVTKLTNGEYGDNEDPTWSPDGNFVAFSSTRSGSSHIWMSTLDGTHQVQLTKGRGGYSNPSWSSPIEW